MSATMKAAIHLGSNYIENMEVDRNTNLEEIQKLFDITQRLILDHQGEILDVTPIEWTAPLFARYTLSHDQVIKWTKARVRVYSDSVLCMSENVRPFRSKSKMGKYSRRISTVQFVQRIRNWWRTNWVRVEYFRRTYGIADSPKDPERSASETLNMKNLKIEFSSCLCSKTSNGQRKETKKIVFQN